jgi:hypothetical protein
MRPLRDGSLDLDAVASAARRLSAVGQQVADVATAAQAANEKRRK